MVGGRLPADTPTYDSEQLTNPSTSRTLEARLSLRALREHNPLTEGNDC